MNGYRNNEETCQHLREQIDDLKKLVHKREETDVQNRELLDSKTDLENLAKSKSDIANRLVSVLKDIQSVLDSYDSSQILDGNDDKEKFSNQVHRLKTVLAKFKDQADQGNKHLLELKESNAKVSKMKLQLKAKMASLNSENDKLKKAKEQYLSSLRSIDNIMFGMRAEKEDGDVEMDFLETIEARIAAEKGRHVEAVRKMVEKIKELEEKNDILELNKNDNSGQESMRDFETKRREEVSRLEERCAELEGSLNESISREDQARVDLQQFGSKLDELSHENDQLRSQYDRVTVEREKLRDDVAGLTANVNVFQSQNSNLMEERNHFQKINQEQLENMEKMSVSFGDVSAINDKIREELLVRDEERLKLHAQLKHMEKESVR